MKTEDLPLVGQIDQVSFSDPWPNNAFATELANPNARCWVMEWFGEVAGFIVVWLVLDEAHLATIAIRQDLRGRGLSRQLAKSALQSAYREGARVSYLEVRESNLIAIHLYQQLGYQTVGLRKGYYKDNHENAILMTMTDFSMVNR